MHFKHTTRNVTQTKKLTEPIAGKNVINEAYCYMFEKIDQSENCGRLIGTASKQEYSSLYGGILKNEKAEKVFSFVRLFLLNAALRVE